MSLIRDPYLELGVSRTAKKQEIVRRYNELKREHLDTPEIDIAFKVLSNSKKRNLFDRIKPADLEAAAEKFIATAEASQ